MSAIILGACMMEILQLSPAVFIFKKRTDHLSSTVAHYETFQSTVAGLTINKK